MEGEGGGGQGQESQSERCKMYTVYKREELEGQALGSRINE